ncbi:CubicO group peptidase (beta-lactamase class C family) [Natranaerovirga pectinivora]|uniref:CubicO group peptidase (Beta-lactamase class C family) n=1 Tax=Natranaerovirga pectinivora TaxID=682400 RepID=A0A4R3MP26_9FIRM|nr:serine hydrolase domain-containing protein [Natranaerovirga pectinivora]TCT16272.1 CubicO group peptidase (beta-lactamase class C family) [Natranaerovirga pectinivora]
MGRKILVFLLFLIVMITPFFISYNSFNENNNISSLIENFETQTPVLLDHYNIPGASISLIEDGELRWIGTFGFADIENQQEINKDTVYQMASISKSVTAFGIMKLVEEGIINLDDPIETYITRWQLPESIYDKSQVTIRRVLSHTAGLSRGGGYPGYESFSELPSLEESLSGIGGGSQPVELIYEPGTRYFYSGGGYNLLQLLIEEVTGQDFDRYMKEVVLIPMEMKDSSFQWEDYTESRIGKAYNIKLEELPNYLFIEKAAAGLYSTIGDISQFVIASINSYGGGDDFLQKGTLKEMYEPVLTVKGLEGFIYKSTALGHFINMDNNNRPLVAHDGGNKGWRTNFSFVPDIGAGIVILTNGDNGTYLINEALNTWYFKVYEEKRDFNKLTHNVCAVVYAISSALILWSLLIIIQLYKGYKKGELVFLKVYTNKIHFIVKIVVSVALIYFAYFIGKQIVPILGFVNTNIGSVFGIAINIRIIIGIIQMFVNKRKIV